MTHSTRVVFMNLSLRHAHATAILASAAATLISACVTARPSYNDDVTARAMYATPGPTNARASRLAEFEQRRRVGQGRFITADVLQANDDIPLVDLLRLRIPGFGNSRDARISALGPGGCMNVYLNGLMSPTALEGMHPHDLVGVEFYDALTAPQQYRQSMTSCSALLLWTP